MYKNHSKYFVYYSRDIHIDSEITAQEFAALNYFDDDTFDFTDDIDFDYTIDDEKDLRSYPSITFKIDGQTIETSSLGCFKYHDDYYYAGDDIPDNVVTLIKKITAPVIKNTHKPLLDLSNTFNISEDDFYFESGY